VYLNKARGGGGSGIILPLQKNVKTKIFLFQLISKNSILEQCWALEMENSPVI